MTIRTIFLPDGESVVVSQEVWMNLVAERFWNAPQMLIVLTPEQVNRLKQAAQ